MQQGSPEPPLKLWPAGLLAACHAPWSGKWSTNGHTWDKAVRFYPALQRWDPRATSTQHDATEAMRHPPRPHWRHYPQPRPLLRGRQLVGHVGRSTQSLSHKQVVVTDQKQAEHMFPLCIPTMNIGGHNRNASTMQHLRYFPSGPVCSTVVSVIPRQGTVRANSGMMTQRARIRSFEGTLTQVVGSLPM